MATKKEIKKIVISVGKPDWLILTDILDDSEFADVLLNDSLRGVLEQIRDNPERIRHQENSIGDIVSKYYAWQIHIKSGLVKLRNDVDGITTEVENAKEKLSKITEVADHISGATVLVKYAEDFKTTAKSHETNAGTHLQHYMISLVGFLTVVGLIFFVSVAEHPLLQKIIAKDIANNNLPLALNTAIISLKLILLLFAFQIMQFFRKNYYVEKHLQQVNQHRSDVLQSLHAVYDVITDAEEKNKILSAGALFAYERGETGYLTTKEGAGSGGGMLETILGGFIKK